MCTKSTSSTLPFLLPDHCSFCGRPTADSLERLCLLCAIWKEMHSYTFNDACSGRPIYQQLHHEAIMSFIWSWWDTLPFEW